MVVEVNDTDKTLRVQEGTSVEDFMNFVNKMGYIRDWTLSIKRSKGTAKMEIGTTPIDGDSPQINPIVDDLIPPIPDKDIISINGTEEENTALNDNPDSSGLSYVSRAIITRFKRTKNDKRRVAKLENAN